MPARHPSILRRRRSHGLLGEMKTFGRGSKTSEDILRERDELRERLQSLEEALSTIAAELDAAAERPDIALVATLRAGSIVRRAQRAMPLRRAPAPPSSPVVRGDDAPVSEATPSNGQRVA